MLGFLKPRGELVELTGRQVVFLTSKAYSRDSQFSVRLTLPKPSDRKLDLDVRVLTQRPGSEKNWVTVAVVETPRPFPDIKGHRVRLNRREPIHLTLKSGDLPGYRAITSDLSVGGFKTELEGELMVHDTIAVTFEFDNPQGVTLDLLARVEWVDDRGGNRFVTGFSFPDQGDLQDNYRWLCEWFEKQGEVQVKRLFKPKPVIEPPPPIPAPSEAASVPAKQQEQVQQEPEDPNLLIPFKGFMRGWAWEQGDDMVVVVLEDDDNQDHWLEFPGCRGLHGRCRDRKIRLSGLRLVAESPLLKEYSRSVTMVSSRHFEFLDDYGRVCLDVIATGCRPQKKSSS